MRPLSYFLGRAVGFFLNLASGFMELRAGFAIKLFHTVLDFLGRVFGFVLNLTADFARSLVGTLLIGLRATG
jgi:hypothetical protein